MNRYQRIILITAAIVLIAALWTTPKYVTYGRGIRFKPSEGNTGFRHTDVEAATARATAVTGAGIFLYFAAGTGLRKRKEVIT